MTSILVTDLTGHPYLSGHLDLTSIVVSDLTDSDLTSILVSDLTSILVSDLTGHPYLSGHLDLTSIVVHFSVTHFTDVVYIVSDLTSILFCIDLASHSYLYCLSS